MTISAVRKSQFPEDRKPEFLLVGRSNVGKSSFINTLINRKNFARTSANPGKTQTLNFYLINDTFYLVDAPGYGYARVNKQLKEKFGLIMEDYLEGRENLKKVFMLIDFRHRPTEDDVMMYKYSVPRIDGDKSELLFDIVTIDRDKRIIYTTRIGAGRDKKINY